MLAAPSPKWCGNTVVPETKAWPWTAYPENTTGTPRRVLRASAWKESRTMDQSYALLPSPDQPPVLHSNTVTQWYTGTAAQ